MLANRRCRRTGASVAALPLAPAAERLYRYQTLSMRDMTQGEWDRVADAIVVWTGKGELAWPQVDDSRVLARFGRNGADELLPVLRELYEDFYTSDAHLRADNLSEMAALASAQFRRKYPFMKQAAVDALAWCYTFDYPDGWLTRRCSRRAALNLDRGRSRLSGKR